MQTINQSINKSLNQRRKQHADQSIVWALSCYKTDYDFAMKVIGSLTLTESGIPDYRSEGVGLYATSKSRPMQYRDFIQSDAFRQRYWARNYIGWPFFSSVQPNASHHILATLERKHPDIFLWLITQNVDSLHLKAGSKNLTELHGTAFQVGCLSCGHTISRKDFQEQLRELNPSFRVAELVVRPDSDVELTDEQIKNFNVQACTACDQKGIMKPFIVYFGENVPQSRVDFCYKKVEESDGLLVIGSSMQVKN